MRSWVSPPHRTSSPQRSAARSASSMASSRAVRSTWPAPRAAPRVGCPMSHKAMDDADAAGMLDADDLLAPLWVGDEPEDAAGLPALQPEQALDLPLRLAVRPRPYQRDAVRQWLEAEGRGVVVLPTGAGKTIVAMMAMEAGGARTLVVLPTIELLLQWGWGLPQQLGVTAESLGLIGGGSHE